MSGAKVKLEGFRELELKLAALPKAVGKGALRRTATLALKPMLVKAKALAPQDTGRLAGSIAIKTTKDRRYADAARASFLKFGSAQGVKRGPSTGVSLSLGPVARRGTNLHKYAYYQEFGRVDMPPQPYMRPAWSATKLEALQIIEDELGNQIDKAVSRLAKRRAKTLG